MEKHEKDDENPEYDPTKDAFFSDLGDMEEEIASEAYELVAHALAVLRDKYYDDAIEILRQAIGLYSQINKDSEITALNNKITEIRLLKEEDFQEVQKEDIFVTSVIRIEETDTSEYEEAYNEADKLIVNGLELINSSKFDEGINNYREAINLLQKINKITEIEKVKELIEDAYIRKAEKIRLMQEQESIEKQQTISEVELKAQKLKAFEEAKRIETELSTRAYELLGKATELVKVRNYDEAISLYEQGIGLFQEINWMNEVKKIAAIIENVRKSKERFLMEIEQSRLEQERLKQLEIEQQTKLEEHAETEQTAVIQEKAEKAREKMIEKQEEEQFQEHITAMIDHAEKLAREYDIEMKKAIKKGQLVETCIYPEVIQIYEEVVRRMDKRGWKHQSEMYRGQLVHFNELLEKDTRLREIEAQKAKKEKIFEESLKVKPEKEFKAIDVEQQKQLEQEGMHEQEHLMQRKNLEKVIQNAERIARDYEITFKRAVKEGNLDFLSEYPQVIEIYSNAKKLAHERGWLEEVAIYTSQIKKYTELLEKENIVRELEVKKAVDGERFKEIHKVKQDSLDFEKVKKVEEKRLKEFEDKQFQEEITSLVDKAEKLAREYEIAKKKAIKQGKFPEESPYLEIIEIYTNIRNKVVKRGWNKQALVYATQIKLYQERLDNDIRLRQIEQEKILKQKEYESSQKAGAIDSNYAFNMDKMTKMQEISEIKTDEAQFEKEIDKKINNAEKAAREYEIAIKKGEFEQECPYLEIAEIYKKIREDVLKRGWKAESDIYANQIQIYLEKFERDKRLRELEAQKVRKQVEYEKALKATPEIRSSDIQKYQRIEGQVSEEEKILNEAMDLINAAENEVRSYELSLKRDILIYSSPYDKAIKNYEDAKKLFIKIGWNEQANQINNSLNFYREKYISDQKLRALEKEKLVKEEEEERKRKLEAKLAKEAEEELEKQKTQALELRKKQAMEYEMKKEQAFNIMDLAKKELKQDNFDKAIKLYLEGEKMFAEINWNEGIKLVKESVQAIKLKKERIEREKLIEEKRKIEKIQMEEQLQEQIVKAQDFKKDQEEKRKRELLELEKEKEKERSISQEAYKLLQEGTKLKDKKKFEQAFEKYTMARDLFKKIDWQHEVSRINNDLMFILKKEMKQAEKIKVILQKKEEEEKELETLLKEAEERRIELEKIRKEEKRKEREQIIQEELTKATDVIKNLKYNEGVFMIKQIIKKLSKKRQEKLIKQLNNQIQVLENASQVPIITLADLELDDDLELFKQAYEALDNAQISLSENLLMKAISELSEAKFKLKNTKIGKTNIPIIINKINSYKKELGIEIEPEEESKIEDTKPIDLRERISERRAERKKRLEELLRK